MLFGGGEYESIYNRIRNLTGVKSDIRYVISPNLIYTILCTKKKTLTFYIIVILTKDKNNYYYNIYYSTTIICHDVLMIFIKLNDIAVLSKKGADYRCIVNDLTKVIL